MIELDDITLKEYFELEDKTEYEFALKYAKPLDVFNVGDFTEFEFGFIKELQQDMNEGLTWINLIEYLERLMKKDKKQIVNYKFWTIARFKSYIEAEIERITEIENELLSYVPDAIEVQAGIEAFNKFGYYGQLRKLAKEDVTKLKEIEKTKYSICLTELYYQKTSDEYQNEYNRIKYKK